MAMSKRARGIPPRVVPFVALWLAAVAGMTMGQGKFPTQFKVERLRYRSRQELVKNGFVKNGVGARDCTRACAARVPAHMPWVCSAHAASSAHHDHFSAHDGGVTMDNAVSILTCDVCARVNLCRR